MIRSLLQTTSTAFMILMLFPLIRCIKTSGYLSGKQNNFFAIGGILSGFSIVILAWLSLTNNGQHHFDHWTFIEEERYMLFVTLIISLWLFQKFIIARKSILGAMILLVMSADLLHGAWVVSTKLKYSTPIAFMAESQETVTFIDEARASAARANRELILADYHYSLAGYAAVRGIKLLSEMRVDEGGLKTVKGKYRVLYRIDKGHEARFPDLLSHPAISSLGIVNFNHFYLQDIVPVSSP